MEKKVISVQVGSEMSIEQALNKVRKGLEPSRSTTTTDPAANSTISRKR